MGQLSLDDLDDVVVIRIVEELWEEYSVRHVAAIRHVCRRFNKLATRVMYGTLVLDERLVVALVDGRYPDCLGQIELHTRHIVARDNLDCSGVRVIVQRAKQLQSLLYVEYARFIVADEWTTTLTCFSRWTHVGDKRQSGTTWMPNEVMSPRHLSSGGPRLHIEGLPLRNFEPETTINPYLSAINSSTLVSLQIAPSWPPLSSKLHALQGLLLASPNLEIFHFRDRGQGMVFEFSDGERLPAVRDLSLCCYDWQHTREEVREHWDISKLTSLALVSVPIYNFLASVDFSLLQKLTRLQIEDSSSHLADLRVQATVGLHVLVKNHIASLQHLSLTLHLKVFPLDAVLVHAKTLSTLSLRDFVGFGNEDVLCPTMTPNEVAMLAAKLARLRVLELDMDFSRPEHERSAEGFMQAVCAFPNLHTLTLHIQTCIRLFEDTSHQSPSRDHDRAMRIFQFLVAHKGATNASSSCHPQGLSDFIPSWKRITINIGGWKKVMIRRLREPWRNLNNLGIFAERCFVLERQETTGHMLVREEFPVGHTW